MATDRGRAALHKLVLLLIPELAGYVQWTYQVLAVYPGPPVTLDLKAMAPSNPFGTTLAGVTMWPGPDGGVCIPTVGKLVMVRFNDTLTPAVCGIDPTDTPAIVYQYGGVVQVGDATAVPLAKSQAVENLIIALGTFSGACEASTVDAVLKAAAIALTASLSPIPATVPTVKALGT
jgi:hypothetical protein